MKSFLLRQQLGSGLKKEALDDDASEAELPKGGKPGKPVDATRMGDLVAFKNGLSNNTPGTTINGTVLRKPVTLYKNP